MTTYQERVQQQHANGRYPFQHNGSHHHMQTENVHMQIFRAENEVHGLEHNRIVIVKETIVRSLTVDWCTELM